MIIQSREIVGDFQNLFIPGDAHGYAVIVLVKFSFQLLNEFDEVALVRLVLFATIRLPTHWIVPVEMETRKIESSQERQN